MYKIKTKNKFIPVKYEQQGDRNADLHSSMVKVCAARSTCVDNACIIAKCAARERRVPSSAARVDSRIGTRVILNGDIMHKVGHLWRTLVQKSESV